MDISISKINKLRKITGIGIMDCKKALICSNGDIEEAIYILKKKGEKIAINRSGIKINEGSVIASVKKDYSYGTIIGISCETDFLSKSKEFLDLLHNTSIKSIDLSEEIFLDFVKNSINKHIGIFKEKMELKVFEKMKAPFVINYTHNNRIAALVGFSKKINKYVAKDIAMHVVALNPISISEEDFPKSILEKEKSIFQYKIDKNKSKEIIDRIIKGKINKLILENTLINQKFIKNNKITILDYLRNYEKESKILFFKRINI
ncbi:translation elongation factor Ts [Blattabacterium cuenoti]|uniref:translation elongation factor Ts n=1 Tax=Blattabacterium cuenoti TaxID=1653831 RepID=UPI00163CCB33|nr:translation elongation factor Ts [Blattabacterium cuenoti]